MSDFPIEKGVPIRGNTPRRYPLREMEVHDSFFVPNKTPGGLSSSLRHARQVTGYRFTTRTVEGGVRVWRIE